MVGQTSTVRDVSGKFKLFYLINGIHGIYMYASHNGTFPFLFNKIVFVNFITSESESCFSLALIASLTSAFPRFDFLCKISVYLKCPGNFY